MDMTLIGTISRIVGMVLLVGGALSTAYFLLFSSVEVKRVVTFAGVLALCATFLLFFERIKTVEVASLGKIEMEAREDAEKIRSVREKVEKMGGEVEQTAKSVQSTAEEVAALTERMEAQGLAIERQGEEVARTAASVKVTAWEVGSLKESVQAYGADIERQGKEVAQTASTVRTTADEVTNLKGTMEQQQRAVTGIMEDIDETAKRITSLSRKTEDDISAVSQAQIEDRKKYLNEQLDALYRTFHGIGAFGSGAFGGGYYSGTGTFDGKRQAERDGAWVEIQRLERELKTLSEPQEGNEEAPSD